MKLVDIVSNKLNASDRDIRQKWLKLAERDVKKLRKKLQSDPDNKSLKEKLKIAEIMLIDLKKEEERHEKQIKDVKHDVNESIMSRVEEQERNYQFDLQKHADAIVEEERQYISSLPLRISMSEYTKEFDKRYKEKPKNKIYYKNR